MSRPMRGRMCFPRQKRKRGHGPLVSGLKGRARDVNVLLLHQALVGATVGPVDFTFRGGPYVVPRAWLPASLDYAALGHVHRHQCLSHPANAALPLVYAGSTERTLRGERFEEKGFVTGELAPGRPAAWRFHPLPTETLRERRAPSGAPPCTIAGQ